MAKIIQSFPNEDTERIWAILDSSLKNEERIQLAVLKLSEGSLEELHSAIDAAKNDWRDVLAWAEYPEEVSNPTWSTDTKEVKKIRDRDRKQYLDWLNC